MELLKKNSQYFIIAFAVILVDFVVKILVNQYMLYGEEIKILGSDTFKLSYVLNPGMAFGATFIPKIFLSLFRLVAAFGISYYILHLSKKGAPKGLLICVGLILGGAVGNLVDSTFFGVFIEGNAPAVIPGEEPWMFPWFHGRVIDMLYVDICDCYVPDWMPIWGGTHLPLWPVFNIADSAIFVGVGWILIKQKSYLNWNKESQNEDEGSADAGSESEAHSTTA